MASKAPGNRVVRLDLEVDPASLNPNPLNARTHPEGQLEALDEALDRVGWVDTVIVNERTGNMLDGHARVESAIARGEMVPVLYVDIPEEDERFVLATHDPLAAMAEWDGEVLAELLDGISFESVGLQHWAADLTGLLEGPPDLDDLADEYDPEKAAGTGLSWLRIEVDDSMLGVWREHRGGFQTDLEALAALFG